MGKREIAREGVGDGRRGALLVLGRAKEGPSGGEELVGNRSS